MYNLIRVLDGFAERNAYPEVRAAARDARAFATSHGTQGAVRYLRMLTWSMHARTAQFADVVLDAFGLTDPTPTA
jgi:hypothetical protein